MSMYYCSSRIYGKYIEAECEEEAIEMFCTIVNNSKGNKENLLKKEQVTVKLMPEKDMMYVELKEIRSDLELIYDYGDNYKITRCIDKLVDLVEKLIDKLDD